MMQFWWWSKNALSFNFDANFHYRIDARESLEQKTWLDFCMKLCTDAPTTLASYRISEAVTWKSVNQTTWESYFSNILFFPSIFIDEFSFFLSSTLSHENGFYWWKENLFCKQILLQYLTSIQWRWCRLKWITKLCDNWNWRNSRRSMLQFSTLFVKWTRVASFRAEILWGIQWRH